jgi:hypothetical protein
LIRPLQSFQYIDLTQYGSGWYRVFNSLGKKKHMSFDLFNRCGRAERSIFEFEEEFFVLRGELLAFLVEEPFVHLRC